MLNSDSIKKTLLSVQEALTYLKLTYVDASYNAVILMLGKKCSEIKESIELTNLQDRDNENQYFHFEELVEDDQNIIVNKQRIDK